jgi:peptidoglycan/LPS O-acetylase OafA/YrhL
MTATMPVARSIAPRTGGREPALDGIRGLAILCVMLVHFNQWRPMLPVESLAKEAIGTLWGGVTLFFVLSGFLITGILYDAKGSPRYFRNFYARRALRIFPLYYATLLFLLLSLRLLIPDSPSYQTLFHNQAWLWGYGTNFLVGRHGWSAAPFASHFWSLAVEEQFYLLWPLVVVRYNRETLLRICVGGIGLSLALRLGWLAAHIKAFDGAYLLPAHFDSLLAGGFLALAARAPRGLAPLARYALPGAVACLALWIGIFLTLGRPFLTTHKGLLVLHLLHTGASAAMLAALVVSSPTSGLRRIFNAQPLRVLGLYSYALYVFHFPISIVVQQKLFPDLGRRASASALGIELRYLLVAGGISLLAAWLSWHLFEKRFLNLKDRFRSPPVAKAESEEAPPIGDGRVVAGIGRTGDSG